MTVYYRIEQSDGKHVIGSNTPDGIRGRLEERADWPEGRYAIQEGDSALLVVAPGDRHWGFAIKAPDGTVELRQSPTG